MHHYEEVNVVKYVYSCYIQHLVTGVITSVHFIKPLHFQIIAAADEVVESIDRDELARFLSIKGDPEEEEFEVLVRFLICFWLFQAKKVEVLVINKWFGSFMSYAVILFGNIVVLFVVCLNYVIKVTHCFFL